MTDFRTQPMTTTLITSLRERAGYAREEGNMTAECDAWYFEAAADRIRELEEALRDIMKATVEGRVCDDVAWFDSVTTLHDFCDLTLNGFDQPKDTAK